VVPVELIAQMRTRLGLESVVTAYGLTETHGTATICEQGDPIELIAATVGHPLEGLELRIVDDGGAEQPAASPGEVLVRGFNVMTEYFDDPEGTRQAIDPDGWLHTGDVGYVGTDGYLRIVDRKKDIVIVGGFNVSSAEIEAVLLQHEDIAHVAVVAMPDSRLGEVTAAFVVARADHQPDPAEVVRWCRERMANFKVPRLVEIVTALPLNASGKVLKRELRQRLTTPPGGRQDTTRSSPT
jgi:acyl-CoA synthetase (AMP-forming)/AMP-acid ligase II